MMICTANENITTAMGFEETGNIDEMGENRRMTARLLVDGRGSM